MKTKLTLLFFLLFSMGIAAPKVSVVKSNQESLQLHILINPLVIDDLRPIHVLIGLPNEVYPQLQVQMLNKQSFSAITDSIDIASIEWVQKQKLRGLNVATLKISPGTDGINTTQYYTEMSISMEFDQNGAKSQTNIQNDILAQKIINWAVAKNWVKPSSRQIQKSSTFPSGQWIKFEIEEDGIYQLTGSDLINILPTINQFDTRTFSLYTGSNLGRSQSQKPATAIPDNNLTEMTFQYLGEAGGLFSEDDKIIFYGRGASGFDLDRASIAFNQNLYFTKNVYWLFIPDNTDLRGKRMTEVQYSGTATINLDYGISYQHLENDLINPFESGLGWVGQSISSNSFIEKSFVIQNPVNEITPNIKIGLQGGTSDNKVRPSPSNRISVNHNTQLLADIFWSGLNQRSSITALSSASLVSGNNSFIITNTSSDNYSQPFFDYLTLSYGRYLVFDGEPFEFFTPIHSNLINFTLSSTITPTIWKINDPSTPINLAVEQSGNNYNFDTFPQANTLDRIIVFDTNNIPTITNMELIGRSTFEKLRNTTTQAEHIILAPDNFRNAVNSLVLLRNNSIFASIEDIYAEFSGGNPDPMAIRNFIDWTQNNWQTSPKYLFLIGDADYDYRNITGNSNNIVPTIEVGIINSYATDDRLVAINGSIPEVAVGRYPARTIAEAEDYIEKLIEYENNPVFGLWRQRVTLIADDGARPEDSASELYIGKSHTINSEILAEIIPATIETNKLYMLEFPEESDATSFGVAKPAATSALLDILEKGTAIVNYIGHGSAHQWAQERLLYQDRGDLQAINTEMKLPLWIAGTCSWGHFDDINRESFSEELIRQPMNGASAIITTSRPITVTSNQYYEEQLFKSIFPNNSVSKLPIGVILQSIKTGNQEGEYFHLFGDPAMKLAIPQNNVIITNVTPDTLQTLGETNYFAEQDITQSSGEGFIVLNDSEREVTREYNYLSNTESLTYKLPGPTLFRGKFSFDDNLINGKLRVPKDISFSNKPVSLKMYIISNDDKPIEALGSKDSLFIISGETTNDNFGPIISFEDSQKRILRSGDHIIENDEVFIRLTDPLGINLTGEVGHNIELTDLATEKLTIITDEFIYDNNSITTGTIPLRIDDNTSEIKLALKAWDSANNPAESEIFLQRVADAKLKLFNVTNFPNPFAKSTQFTFELSQAAEIDITIFTLGGRKILHIEPEYFTIGYHAIDWDGYDAFGDKLANGVYLYRLKAVGDEETASFIGRLAKYE